MSAREPVTIDEPPIDTPIGPHDDEPPFEPPRAKRNSVFPLMVDIGAVIALFGLIIGMPLWDDTVGGAMIGVGITIVVIGLIGWFVEARADFRRMPD